MATQREKDASDYLEKHKIMALIGNLTSMLFFHRPENPREFLADLLELQRTQQTTVKGPNLFNNSNLDAVFRIMDPGNQKYIHFEQYKHALTTLGIKDINECPEGVNEDKISQETFRAEGTQGLARS